MKDHFSIYGRCGARGRHTSAIGWNGNEVSCKNAESFNNMCINFLSNKLPFYSVSPSSLMCKTHQQKRCCIFKIENFKYLLISEITQVKKKMAVEEGFQGIRQSYRLKSLNWIILLLLSLTAEQLSSSLSMSTPLLFPPSSFRSSCTSQGLSFSLG